jgi:hypothetical protein
MLKLARKRREKHPVNETNHPPARNVNTDSLNNKVDNPYKSGCPATKDALGESTWKLMHTIAANYPEVPSEADQTNALNFFQALAWLYPCPICAPDFQSSMKKYPPEYVLFIII